MVTDSRNLHRRDGQVLTPREGGGRLSTGNEESAGQGWKRSEGDGNPLGGHSIDSPPSIEVYEF